jgi:hypothetical protein
MAEVDIEEIVDSLRSEVTRALDDAVTEVLPDAEIDRNDLFRAFKQAIRRKCATWEKVPDSTVKV